MKYIITIAAHSHTRTTHTHLSLRISICMKTKHIMQFVSFSINTRLIKNLATNFLKCVCACHDRLKKSVQMTSFRELTKGSAFIYNNIINSTLISTINALVMRYAQFYAIRTT